MLGSKEFDLWADSYDKIVNIYDSKNEYPFAGYKQLLGTIYNEIRSRSTEKILDIGFGTGILTNKLYEDGYKIFGIDFSKKMIEIAKEKMPEATLIHYDFSKGLPNELLDIKFDCIICTYAIHHLSDEQKIMFIHLLLNSISEGGIILIGDIAFKTRDELLECKTKCRDEWDGEEIYIVYDELMRHFKNYNIEFKKVSHCAGIIAFTK